MVADRPSSPIDDHEREQLYHRHREQHRPPRIAIWLKTDMPQKRTRAFARSNNWSGKKLTCGNHAGMGAQMWCCELVREAEALPRDAIRP